MHVSRGNAKKNFDEERIDAWAFHAKFKAFIKSAPKNAFMSMALRTLLLHLCPAIPAVTTSFPCQASQKVENQNGGRGARTRSPAATPALPKGL